MRSNKKYTNQTISKRVDHEAGRHRPPRASSEPVVCEVCGNVYSDRRWAKPDASRQSPKHPHIRPPKSVICPACQAERDGIAGGYVHLEGEFLKTHRQEIERLLNNEAARAAEDNPLARIMKMETDKKGRLTVVTTTEHLAQRLGHALEKAFNGEVRYDFSHENKLAHVWWKRD